MAGGSNFIDYVKIFCRSGRGGAGSLHFHRAKYVPKGGPDGGDGGRGGHVILRGNRNLWTLLHLKYKRHVFATNGQAGGANRSTGRDGEDQVVEVPCGTAVYDADTGEFLCDVTEDGEEVKLLKGGRGGLGNWQFKSATNRTPRYAQPGEPGIEKAIVLELKLLADVGLVGFPNAGKSTLLTAISRARPKIASYPFTTLHPQIGIVEYPYDYHRLTVCDVPGLIPGAHQNKGLGHAFLRHIRRCKIIVLLIDISAIEGRKPWDDYQQLLHELELYDAELLNRPRLILANKMDEPESEKNLKEFKQHLPGQQIIPLSAAFDEGISEFLEILRQAVAQAPEPPKQEVKSENIDLINGEHI